MRVVCLSWFMDTPLPTPRKEEAVASRFERRKSLARQQVGLLRDQFAQAKGLPFANLLESRVVSRTVEEECPGSRARIFSPLVTLWAFLIQILDEDQSCRKAVARVQAYRASKGLTKCSPNTGGYCQARKRLPERLLARLVRWTGRKLNDETASKWVWKGRNVKVVDGSTVSMPDTPANQKEYPQQRGQKKGLGFPIARIVVVFSLATGSALDLALSKFRGGKSEKAMFSELAGTNLVTGDVLLGDRHFAGYCDVAMWLGFGVDIVLRQHQSRKTDFRRGKRLGRDDHLVTWQRPRQRPPSFDQATFAALPSSIPLRECRFQAAQKGFRVKDIILVTNMTDPDEVTKEELADLFRLRWHAELDLRSLKTEMKMDVLRCQSPQMVRKEIWAHLLVYNLIRGLIAQSAYENDRHPLQISFTGARQTLDAFASQLLHASRSKRKLLRERILWSIAKHQVGNRPDRYEPRAVKRRPKPYAWLMVPRPKARKKLLSRRA